MSIGQKATRGSFKRGHPCHKREEATKRLRAMAVANRGVPRSSETKTKIGAAHKGMKRSKKARANMRRGQLGKKRSASHITNATAARRGYSHSAETRAKISATHRARKNKRKTDESRLWRLRIEYRLWREAVFARDNWTCQKCKKRGADIHPHHVRNFAEVVALRFAIDNGATLCVKDHKLFHKIYGQKKNNAKQLREFIS